LNSDFRQLNYTPKPVPFGPDSYCNSHGASQGVCAKIWLILAGHNPFQMLLQKIIFNDICTCRGAYAAVGCRKLVGAR
jgi:hypothetical protein